jgi:hypothetical protein
MKTNPKNKNILAAGACFNLKRATSQSHKVLRAALFLLLTIYPLNICQSAQESQEAYFNQVVDAIYLAEGGAKAKKPFGILSVPCSGYASCRRICLNTVRNNYKRWQNAGKPGEFLAFLASRYAPIEVHPLNKNWLPNVRHFLEVL